MCIRDRITTFVCLVDAGTGQGMPYSRSEMTVSWLYGPPYWPSILAVASSRRSDALVTGSRNYTIRDGIDDGTGMTTLMLEAD